MSHPRSIDTPHALDRVPTGIPGLDTIIGGGLFRGGMYIVVGHPGTGKTILGNQTCFAHVAGGGRAVYVTLMAESHGRMLAHLRSMTFFRMGAVADAVFYINGYGAMRDRGLDGLIAFIRGVVRERRATLVVVDGLLTALDVAATPLDYKQFLHSLQFTLQTQGCTTLLLTQNEWQANDPVHTMVDGVFALQHQLHSVRAARELIVHKFRGSGFLGGRHLLRIGDDGITVYPRTESLLAGAPPDTRDARTRLSLGVPRLDQMLGGGILSGSTTMLLGAPGVGKTLLGLHTLAAGASNGEPGLYFGFSEPPSRLLAKAQGVGLDIEPAYTRGLLQYCWQIPLEDDLEPIAETLLQAVREQGTRRLVIDGLAGLLRATNPPERLGPFLTALTAELRRLDVTLLFTAEMPTVLGPEIRFPQPDILDITENIIFLRFVELRSQLYRLLSILKVRDSAYDPSIREFSVSSRGITVASTFESAEAILTGVARPVATLAIDVGDDAEPGRHLAGDGTR